MITLTQKGDFRKTDRFLERIKEFCGKSDLDKYGELGVEALRQATPVDTGKTRDSWGYEIVHKKRQSSIVWTNSNINDGVLIAILIQYGHGNGNGAYVKGTDYINPAMAPVFEEIADKVWKEVTRS